jgi:hypothetical protein
MTTVASRSASTKDSKQTKSKKSAPKTKAKAPEVKVEKKKQQKKKSAKKAPKKEKLAAEVEKGDGVEKKQKRQFKILVDTIEPKVDPKTAKGGKGLSENGGKYTGSNPLQAAKKAFTGICRRYGNGKEGECKFHFSLQEITEGSKKSTFTYDGVRKRLVEPQIIKKEGKSYPVYFKPHVTASKPLSKKKAKKTTEDKPSTEATPQEEQKVIEEKPAEENEEKSVEEVSEEEEEGDQE